MANQVKETETNYTDLVLNPGSERNLISICLKDESKVIEVESAEIFPEHFGVIANKYIYMAITYLYSKKIKPTPMAIIEVLNNDKARKSVEELGGLEYLTLLEEANIPPDNLRIFIEKIKQSYTRRMMYSIGKEMQDFVLSNDAETLNPSEIVGWAEQRLTDLSVNSSQVQDVYKMGDETERILEERAESPSAVPGLEVGWIEYDRITNGALPGDLIVVVAESKTGKSVTLTNWATKLSIQDQIPILYIDTEMSSREQEDRILSNLTGIPHNEIVSGMYVVDTEFGSANEKISKLRDAREKLNLGQYYHIYMPQFSSEKVTMMAKKFQMQFGIKAIFFDYIKIPSSQGNSYRNMQEYQQLGFFASSLKDIAGILKIPVFTAAQANREDLGSDEAPDAGRIGGSYRILQLASKLIFLVNKTDERIAKEGWQNGNQRLFIKYQRNGASDCAPINIFFNKPILRQTEV